MRVQESSHSPKIRQRTPERWGVALAGAGVAAAYCLVLRRSGLELADEGVLLAQMDRVVHGQIPYRDFHTGYGPGIFWLQAWAFAWFGVSVGTVRVGLAVVHAARAMLLGCLAGAAGGPAWAGVAALALLAFFLPVAPGICAPGNIPYPAWFADALGLTALLLLVRDRPPLVAIGMLWGAVFAFRQNSGVLGLGAAVVTTMLAGAPAGDRPRAGALVAIAMLAGAALLLHEFLDATLAVVFIVPLLPLALALARAPLSGETMGGLVRLGMGFVVVAGGAVALMVAQAGVEPVATDFLQIGTDTVRTYHVAHPTPASVFRMLEGTSFVRTSRILGDMAWFAILPALHLVAALLVAAGRLRSRVALAIVPAAALGYLQLYPRMDFWHVLALAPASLSALALIATAVPTVGRIGLALLALASLGRLVPTVPVLASMAGGPDGAPRVSRIDVRWDLMAEDRLRLLPDVIETVQGRERVAGFPALGMVNFAIGRPSPWRHDYFYPGRPLPAEERALADAVERDPPDAVVILDDPGATFEPSFHAHRVLLDAIERRCRDERRIGPYRILVPRPAS
jgi:hypothetical protein